jgi:hypothetical protein
VGLGARNRSLRVTILGLDRIFLKSSDSSSNADTGSLLHGILGRGEEVLADVGVHVGIVDLRELAVGLDLVRVVLGYEGNLAIVPEGRATACDIYGQIVGTNARAVRLACGLIQREPKESLVGLPETPVGLGVRRLSDEENFLYPGGTPVSRVRHFPVGTKAALATLDRNRGGSLLDTAPVPVVRGGVGVPEKLSDG